MRIAQPHRQKLHRAWNHIREVSTRYGTPHHMLQAAGECSIGDYYTGITIQQLDGWIDDVIRVAPQMHVPVDEIREAMLAFRSELQLYRRTQGEAPGMGR